MDSNMRPKWQLLQQIWRTFKEPKLVEATIQFEAVDEIAHRVSHITIHDWVGQTIELSEVNMYHQQFIGDQLNHVYSCTDPQQEIFFRVLFCTKSLRVFVLGVCGASAEFSRN